MEGNRKRKIGNTLMRHRKVLVYGVFFYSDENNEKTKVSTGR